MTKQLSVLWTTIALVTVGSGALAASPVEVSGRFLDEDGSVATGLGVTFELAASTCGPPAIEALPVAARTDSAGRYRLDLDPSVVWQMRVRWRDDHEIVRVVPPLFGPERMPPLRLPARPEGERTKDNLELGYGYRLEVLGAAGSGDSESQSEQAAAVVRVLDASSRPLPGAMVWMPDQPRCWGRADRQGDVRLAGAGWAGGARLMAGAKGYEPRAFDGLSEASANVRLSEAHGVLIDAVRDVAKQPIEDAWAYLPSVRRGAWSDPKGLIVLRHLTTIGKAYSVERSKDGYLPRSGTRVVVEPPEPPYLDAVVPMTLYRSSTVTGRLVLGEETDREDLRAYVGDHPEISSAIDDAGRFELAAVPNGQFAVTFAHGSTILAFERFTVPGTGERVDLGAIALPPGGRIAGVVTTEMGHPLAGVSISLGHAKSDASNRPSVDNEGRPIHPVVTTTDDAGSFRIAGLAVDDRLTVVATQESYLPRETTVAVHEGEQRIEFVLPALAEQTIRVISDADEMPLPGAVVWLELGVPETLRDGLHHHTLRTAHHETGEIRVPVFPNGTGRYDVMMEGFVGQAGAFQFADDPEREPIVLRLEPESVVTGTVWSVDGSPVPGARIGVASAGRGEVFDGSARADADGRFVARGLPSGPTTLIVRAQGYRELRHELDILPASTTDIDFQMEPATRFRLRGQVWIEGEGALEPPATIVPMGTSYRPVMTDADGWFDLGRLAEGSYFLVVSLGPGLTVVSGDHVDMTTDRLDWKIVLRRASDQP